MPHTGVIVVDLQGDFTTWKGGALAVAGTDQAYVEEVQEATRTLNSQGYPVFATQDWHPPDHVSFYTNHPGKEAFETIEIHGRKQVLWPPHCVQGTHNARILVDNNLFIAIVKKGQRREFDSYSGFQDDGGNMTELDSVLKINGIQRLLIYGIATDYCVRATATDAVSKGYETIVIEGLCRGVTPEGTADALEEMRTKGVRVLRGLNLEALGGGSGP
ncbi:MAG: isochorismatase family protein [Thermodesulfobacteriota bacterium]